MSRKNVVGTSRKVRLTEDVIRRAEPLPPKRAGDPPIKRVLLDTRTVGFGIAVNANSKSYIVVRRVAGKQVRFKFRRVGEISLQEARTEAERLLVEMGSGVNPIARKRADRAAAAVEKARGIALGEAIALREASMRARGRGARTIAENHYTITKYLAAWLDRPSALGILFGILAQWRGNLRANIIVHAWADLWSGWLKAIVWVA